MLNAKHFCKCILDAPKDSHDIQKISRPRAAVLNGAKWQPGDLVSCRFLSGTPALHERVKSVAREWERFAELTLDFRDHGSTDIRIDFVRGNGSWSYLGTFCRRISEPEPTMNYGWIDEESDEQELRRVVLHEFGHALGLIHEHQNPENSIKWNKAAVVADLQGPPNYWDDNAIENNMFRYYPKEDVTATAVDPTSIMMYPIPASWTLDGFSAGLNSELSPADKALIGAVYPK
ncbi:MULTISPECIES: M12 family metallopeptidase [Sinorhizobium]|uniref:M12 family metallopeptidase n=1 Tax=Sinorhizobium TaxID=28105 RepID=UPI0024B07A01|nr:M12 family metallopeptidase [Sinorhizobium terangae]WFU51884.1 M12 family metallopeptidase [Sinorhizobium terangae]